MPPGVPPAPDVPLIEAPYGWGIASPHAPPIDAPPQATAPQPFPRDTARVRAIHAMPDVEAIDVYLNGRRLMRGISYKAATDYFTVPAGAYRVELYRAGQTTAPIAVREVHAAAGASYTFAGAGEGAEVGLFAYADQPFAPASAVRLRFLHLGSGAPAVDGMTAEWGPLFRGMRFAQATPYATVAPGAYDVELLAAGTNESVLTIPNLRLSAGVAYTVAVIGRAVGEPGLEAKLLRG
ncbi:DUF4397 domain-containing protein [Paenibacillus sp. TRM 82003]|nr:DUF4397 domain-containing protein [Paenibacillus sp. TRM 82003]